MITFDNIITKFEEFAEDNFFIKSFSYGSPSDADLDKFELYPIMHVVYTGASYSGGTKTYNLEVYIMSIPQRRETKRCTRRLTSPTQRGWQRTSWLTLSAVATSLPLTISFNWVVLQLHPWRRKRATPLQGACLTFQSLCPIHMTHATLH